VEPAPIGPVQPVALLDLRIAKSGFAGDPRRGLCKFVALQGLSQIARVGDAPTLFARGRARSADPTSDPIPVGAIVSDVAAGLAAAAVTDPAKPDPEFIFRRQPPIQDRVVRLWRSRTGLRSATPGIATACRRRHSRQWSIAAAPAPARHR